MMCHTAPPARRGRPRAASMALRRAAFLSATTPGKLEQVAERTSKITHREFVWASTEVKLVARGGRPTAVVIARARQPMKSTSPAGQGNRRNQKDSEGIGSNQKNSEGLGSILKDSEGSRSNQKNGPPRAGVPRASGPLSPLSPHARARQLSGGLPLSHALAGAGAGACNDATAPSCAAALASRHALPPPLD